MEYHKVKRKICTIIYTHSYDVNLTILVLVMMILVIFSHSNDNQNHKLVYKINKRNLDIQPDPGNFHSKALDQRTSRAIPKYHVNSDQKSEYSHNFNHFKNHSYEKYPKVRNLLDATNIRLRESSSGSFFRVICRFIDISFRSSTRTLRNFSRWSPYKLLAKVYFYLCYISKKGPIICIVYSEKLFY